VIKLTASIVPRNHAYLLFTFLFSYDNFIILCIVLNKVYTPILIWDYYVLGIYFIIFYKFQEFVNLCLNMELVLLVLLGKVILIYL
jgi:hypothetical protein